MPQLLIVLGIIALSIAVSFLYSIWFGYSTKVSFPKEDRFPLTFWAVIFLLLGLCAATQGYFLEYVSRTQAVFRVLLVLAVLVLPHVLYWRWGGHKQPDINSDFSP